jgi:plasmid stabilization system protein ParE
VLAVRLSLIAERDLEQIGDYIAMDNPELALRAASHGRYLLLYSLNEDCVLVERVIHGSRNLKSLPQ